jgi:hypothetical protein
MSLDGTDFRIQEPRPFSTKWFSSKFRGPGLRYKVGLCIRTGHIVWVYSSYPCGEYPDLKLAREAFSHMLGQNEKAIADRGYRDIHFVTPYSCRTERSLRVLKHLLARHETVNKRFKDFVILREIYRHDLDFHIYCFQAVANIVQLNIQHGHPLFVPRGMR